MGAHPDDARAAIPRISRVRLFDITERTEYYVESNGVRSALFRIDVANLPYVKKIDLEYRYPGFTGMAPRDRSRWAVTLPRRVARR